MHLLECLFGGVLTVALSCGIEQVSFPAGLLKPPTSPLVTTSSKALSLVSLGSDVSLGLANEGGVHQPLIFCRSGLEGMWTRSLTRPLRTSLGSLQALAALLRFCSHSWSFPPFNSLLTALQHSKLWGFICLQGSGRLQSQSMFFQVFWRCLGNLAMFLGVKQLGQVGLWAWMMDCVRPVRAQGSL